MEIKVAGDSSLVVKFGNEIDEKINQKVRAFRLAAEKRSIKGIIEYIPTYCTVYVIYDPLVIGTDALIKELENVAKEANEVELPASNIVEVPVAYGGEYGPDLENVASAHNLTPKEIIERHCAKDYLVYMLGFTPGFSFCGALGDDVATPRLKQPRTR